MASPCYWFPQATILLFFLSMEQVHTRLTSADTAYTKWKHRMGLLWGISRGLGKPCARKGNRGRPPVQLGDPEKPRAGRDNPGGQEDPLSWSRAGRNALFKSRQHSVPGIGPGPQVVTTEDRSSSSELMRMRSSSTPLSSSTSRSKEFRCVFQLHGGVA